MSLRVLFALLSSLLVSAAAAPLLDGFFPAGGARGTTNVITAIGKFDPWPPKVWVQGEGLTFTAETNKGKLSVTVADNAEPGPRLVRLFDEEGASEPRVFVIGGGREIIDAEPNNHFAKPQMFSAWPVTINGRLDKAGDVDSFAINLRAGEWLDARVDCYTLMSKADTVLRLVTTNGLQLAWNHDFTTLDPRLIWRATSGGVAVLQIFGFAYPFGSDISLTGGESTAYRLHLAVTNSLPVICANPTEKEPNNSTVDATPLELPATVFARINGAEDEDRFRFAATKGQFIEARVEATSLGSPLDAWLKIEDTGGNQLVRNDDAEGSSDPRLEWKATNASFVIAVGSVTHRGGSDYCYRLSVQAVQPDFQVTLGASSLVLTAGATNELKMDVKRLRGFTNKLSVGVRGLPEGATLLTTNLPEKETSIKLAANADAPKFQGPFQVIVRGHSEDEERIVPFELTTRGETPYTRLLVEKNDQLWLTVRPKPEEKKKSAKEK